MSRQRKMAGRGLDVMPVYRKKQRTYDGKIGSINTLNDIREWLHAAKADRSINDAKRARRIHFLYAISFSSRFKNQWRGQPGDILEARKILKNAYESYR